MNENLQEILKLINQYSDYINQNQRKSKKKLNSKERISFALDYYDITNESIIEILKIFDQKDSSAKKEITDFMGRNSFFKRYPNTTYEYQKPYDLRQYYEDVIKTFSISTLKKEYNYQNWLEPFDEDTIFSTNGVKRPAITKFPALDGTLVTFDKKRATEIKLAIMDQGITPARCIVQSAYPSAAKGQLDEYIKTLKKEVRK